MSLTIRKLFTCTESDSFRPTRKEFERARTEAKSTPDNSNHENSITPAEYELSLRLAIQEFQKPGQAEITQVENILPFEKLIDSELMRGHEKIAGIMETKTKISNEHPKREFIDIENEEIASQIESWTENLVKNIKAERGIAGLSQDEIYELEALAWFHFDSLASAANAKSLEQDIN